MSSHPTKKLKTIVVMPAYNAEATLEKTISDIPFDHVDELILVDDASHDNTVHTAQNIGSRNPLFTFDAQEAVHNPNKKLFTVIKLEHNKGYGGNQKKCYEIALAHEADIVIMLHPDYQYDPKLITYFVAFIRDGYFDVMLGSRIRSRIEALAGGMPLYKYYANRALSFIENIASGRSLSEWHTGMRAYKRTVLENIHYQRFSDDFIFDTQALFAIVEKGYSIGDIPVPVRYFKEASSINFSRSTRYGILTLWETLKFSIRNSKQFLIYVIVGATAATTNLSLYSILIYHMHIWYLTAAFISFCCAAVVSFTLHKYWTFRKHSLKNLTREIALYLAIAIFNSAINGGLLFVFVQWFSIHKLFANIISNSIVALWSFFIYKYITFKK